MPEDIELLVYQRMQVQFSLDLEKYLGLPNMMGKKKKMGFHILKDILLV